MYGCAIQSSARTLASPTLAILLAHTTANLTRRQPANRALHRNELTLTTPSTLAIHTPSMASTQSVQCFGKKKTATAVAHCKTGKGLIKVNGKPLSLVQPEILRFKVYEPVLILGLDKFGAFVRNE